MATSSLGFDNFFSTTLNGAISDSDLTITLNAVPTASEGFLVIEPDNASKREIIYYTSKGASTVTVPSGAGNGRGYDGTTATSHSDGVDVIMAPVAAMFEALQDGSGLASGFALPSGSVDPEDLTSGAGTSWTWQDWTPSYTNITVGDGTVVAKYAQIGKTVHFFWSIVVGSTSAVTNGHTISLPVTAASRYGTSNAYSPIGLAYTNDITGNAHAGWVRANSTTVMQPTWGTAGSGSQQTATFPINEATGDTYVVTGTYEAA